MSDTIYLDCFSGLVPVKPLHIEKNQWGQEYVACRVLRDKGAYREGEIIYPLKGSGLVHKSGRSGVHQMVRTATLPELETKNVTLRFPTSDWR